MKGILIFCFLGLSLATSFLPIEKNNLEVGASGVLLLNVTFIGPTVTGSQLDTVNQVVLDVTNQNSLNGKNSFHCANQIKSQLEAQLGITLGVFISQAHTGSCYFSYVNGFAITDLLQNTATQGENFFFVSVFQQNTNKPSLSSQNLPAVSSQETIMSPPLVKHTPLTAYFVKTLYQGSAVNSDMKNNLITYALQAAEAYNLNVQNYYCYHCYETSQSTALSANFGYRSIWTVDTLIYNSTAPYGGLAVTPTPSGRTLSIVINSNNYQFSMLIAATRDN